MESEQWFNDRQVGERLLRASGQTTPAALKTLQDHELRRTIELLARAIGLCGLELEQRPTKERRKRGSDKTA